MTISIVYGGGWSAIGKFSATLGLGNLNYFTLTLMEPEVKMAVLRPGCFACSLHFICDLVFSPGVFSSLSLFFICTSLLIMCLGELLLVMYI